MNVFRLESFRPPRECLVSLCEQARAMGLLTELPKGRGTSPFIAALRDIGRQHHPALIIDDLSTVTSVGVYELRKLKDTWVIVAGLDRRRQNRVSEIFFGSHDILDLMPLPKAEARQLAEEASKDIDLPSKASFLADVVNQSQGNPQVVLDLVDRARRTQETGFDHPGRHKTLPATPFLSLFLLWAFLGRYTAASLGQPDWKVLLVIAIVALSVVVVFDKILVKGSRL